MRSLTDVETDIEPKHSSSLFLALLIFRSNLPRMTSQARRTWRGGGVGARGPLARHLGGQRRPRSERERLLQKLPRWASGFNSVGLDPTALVYWLHFFFCFVVFFRTLSIFLCKTTTQYRSPRVTDSSSVGKLRDTT